MVDDDPLRFTVAVFQAWKNKRESDALAEIMGGPTKTELLRPLACYVEYTTGHNLLFGLRSYNPTSEIVLVNSLQLISLSDGNPVPWRRDRPVHGQVHVDGLPVDTATETPFNLRSKGEHIFLRYVDLPIERFRENPRGYISEVNWSLRHDPSQKGSARILVYYFEREAMSDQPADVKPPVSVRFGFKTLDLGGGRIHRYSLTASISCDHAPAPEHIRLDISWPSGIQIVRLDGINEGELKRIERRAYRSLQVGTDRPMFPGETVQALGQGSGATLEYEFDLGTHTKLMERPEDLLYTLYLANQEPISGRVPFSQLNEY